MAYVTALHKKEKTVYYVETKGAYDVPEAQGRLMEAGCVILHLWAVPPTFENEFFVEKYPPDLAWEIKPL